MKFISKIFFDKSQYQKIDKSNKIKKEIKIKEFDLLNFSRNFFKSKSKNIR